MTKTIVFQPAIDSELNPELEFDIRQGVEIWFMLSSQHRALHLRVQTKWMEQKSMDAIRDENEGRLWPELLLPDVRSVVYHSPKQLADTDELDPLCDVISLPCYEGHLRMDLSTQLFELLVEQGSRGLWAGLEDTYKKVFGMMAL